MCVLYVECKIGSGKYMNEWANTLTVCLLLTIKVVAIICIWKWPVLFSILITKVQVTAVLNFVYYNVLSCTYVSTYILAFIYTCVHTYMYHFAWADQREKQVYKCDVSLKRGIQIICTLENDATLYIDTTKPLLIVGLNLLIILNL